MNTFLTVSPIGTQWNLFLSSHAQDYAVNVLQNAVQEKICKAKSIVYISYAFLSLISINFCATDITRAAAIQELLLVIYIEPTMN